MSTKGIFSHPVAHQVAKISAELVQYDGSVWVEFNFVDRHGQTGQFVVHATSTLEDGLAEWVECTNTIFEVTEKRAAAKASRLALVPAVA